MHMTGKDDIRSSVLLTNVFLDVERYFKGKSVLLIVQSIPGQSVPESLESGGAGQELSVLFFSPAKGNTASVADALSGTGDADADGYVTLDELKKAINSKGKVKFFGSCDPAFVISRVKLSDK